MKRIIGAVLMLGGAFSLYCFAAGGVFHGRDISAPALGLPFLALGHQYPADAALLVGAFWGLLVGLVLVVLPQGGASRTVPAAASGSAAAKYAAGASRRGGTIARIMLLNGLFLLSTLFIAYIGGKSGKDVSIVGVFGLVALAQMATGVILAILAFFERPKGLVSLVLGVPINLFGIVIGLLAFFVWGRG